MTYLRAGGVRPFFIVNVVRKYVKAEKYCAWTKGGIAFAEDDRYSGSGFRSCQ